MQNKTLGILILILLLFSACKEEETPLSSTKQLLSFSILVNDNQGKVKNDVKGSIKGNVITLSMDEYDDLKSLIATFRYEGTSVKVNEIEQESGVTLNDYSHPLTIIVEAEDGSREQYTVEVVLKDAQVLSEFRFLRKDNPLLTADVLCAIEEESESVVSSYMFPQSKLIPVFTTNAVKVMVDDVEQVSGVTENDFSSPVTYQFVMRNGEIVRYTIALDFILIFFIFRGTSGSLFT